MSSSGRPSGSQKRHGIPRIETYRPACKRWMGVNSSEPSSAPSSVSPCDSLMLSVLVASITHSIRPFWYFAHSSLIELLGKRAAIGLRLRLKYSSLRATIPKEAPGVFVSPLCFISIFGVTFSLLIIHVVIIRKPCWLENRGEVLFDTIDKTNLFVGDVRSPRAASSAASVQRQFGSNQSPHVPDFWGCPLHYLGSGL